MYELDRRFTEQGSVNQGMGEPITAGLMVGAGLLSTVLPMVSSLFSKKKKDKGISKKKAAEMAQTAAEQARQQVAEEEKQAADSQLKIILIGAGVAAVLIGGLAMLSRRK